MIKASIAAVLLILMALPARAQPADEVRDRLAAYEKGIAAGRADNGELAAIATLVLDRTVLSTQPNAMIQACSSRFLKDAADCNAKLWALARRTGAALAHRASAAAALAERKDKEAPAYLFEIVKGAPAQQLAPIAFLLRSLPAERSVPLLAPLLRSGNEAAAVEGCRALAQVSSAESLKAVNEYLESAPRGTPQWFACTLAAARLGDPAGLRTSGFITNYLAGEDLVTAADLLLTSDPERALSLLLQTTRESPGMARLEAAERLTELRPQVSADIMEQALKSDQAGTRAAALEIHRRLRLEPSPEVRRLLLDPDPIVQLRAAETVLAADARRRGVQGG
jgi:hypothetical protein